VKFLNFCNVIATCAVSVVYSAHKHVAFIILVRNHVAALESFEKSKTPRRSYQMVLLKVTPISQ